MEEDRRHRARMKLAALAVSSSLQGVPHLVNGHGQVV